MSDHAYKLIEITGSSATSSDDAIRCAIERAGASLHNLRWFQLTELRGDIHEGRVAHWQATVKIGFRLDDRET